MSTQLLARYKVSEPRIWSIGMCGIAIVMLIMTFSQSGSLANNASQTLASTHISTTYSGGAPKAVYGVVQDDVVEQSRVISAEVALRYGSIEKSIEPEDFEVTDEVQRKFLQYVQQANLAKRIDNNELSARLAIEAQALLFGSGEHW